MHTAIVLIIEICISDHFPSGGKINTQIRKLFENYWSRGCTDCTKYGQTRLNACAMIRQVEYSGIYENSKHNFNCVKFMPLRNNWQTLLITDRTL